MQLFYFQFALAFISVQWSVYNIVFYTCMYERPLFIIDNNPINNMKARIKVLKGFR